MQAVHRIGFTQLSGSEGTREHSRLSNSIIFVHGLRGHPVKTWESRSSVDSESAAASSGFRHNVRSLFKSKAPVSESDNETRNDAGLARNNFWPKDYLAEDIPGARVWTYGYNAEVVGGSFQANNKNSVSQHGRDLRVKLERDLENEDPIIFVAHSLGGIIVKDALNKSEKSRARTKLVIFLGTPHRGSTMAGWGEIASNLAILVAQDSHKKIIETLEVNSEVLDNIYEDFKTVVDQYGIRIHSFQEARGISGMKGLSKKVVSDFSSKLDLPRSLETVESIDANHMQMARVKDRSDPHYRALFGVLKQAMISRAPNGEIVHNQRTRSIKVGTGAQGEEIGHQIYQTLAGVSMPSYNIPFLRNRRFIGRETKLKELEDKFFTSDDCQKLALVGLGGVGKTQVALQFAYRVKERWPEYSIFWVAAVSSETFEQGYRAIATSCSIPQAFDEKDRKESVKRYLSSDLAGKWLLIVDNSDEYELLFGISGTTPGITDYLPESEDGLILFTTCHREMAVSLAGSEVVEVQEMSYSEAETFLGKSFIRKELLCDKTVTTELLTKLTYLPLAIAQAAAYLNTIQISIQEYLVLLRNTEQDMIDLMSREFHDSTRYKTSKNSIAATWLVSFDQIFQSNPNAAKLLSFMSCIENKAIPRSILPSVKSEEQLVHSIGTLSAYAFITRRGNSDIYDMHRLVHLATKLWMDKNGSQLESRKEAARQPAKVFPSDGWENRDIWRKCLPYALQFLKNSKELNDRKRHDLCLAVASCLRNDGRIGEALSYVLECFLWTEEHLTKDHPFRLESARELADLYRQNGQIEKAIHLLEHIIAIQAQMLPKDDPHQLAAQHGLAMAYSYDNQPREAIRLLEPIVAIDEQMLAEDDPYRLSSQHELASAYLKDGQVEKAVKLLERTVAIRQVLSEDHPSRLSSQHTLADAYLKDGQIKKAIKLFEHFVAIRTESLADHHPYKLSSEHALALAYLADEQFNKAVELLEKAVTIQERSLAEDHQNRLISEHELARAYLADKQVKKAVELLKKVVAMRKKSLAEHHPSRLGSEHELARAYLADEQFKEAVDLFEKVVAIQEKTLAEDDPVRLVSEEALSIAYEWLRSSSQR